MGKLLDKTIIAANSSANIGKLLAERLGTKRVLLVFDSGLPANTVSILENSLANSGFDLHKLTVDQGEAAKSLANLERLWNALASAGLGRDGLVVAVGGGALSDVAGFAAATYMRGVQLVLVPTTLLAMVDAAIGGKNAINFANAKNRIGTVYQPLLTLIDPELLVTLPEAAYKDGLAETVKTALLSGGEFLQWIEAEADNLLARQSSALSEAIQRAVAFKLAIVQSDPLDNGPRQILNYGHTLGHALERALPEGSVSHGAAVVMGMRFAAQVAEREMAGAQGIAKLQEDLFARLGLDAQLSALPGLNPKDILPLMQADKKNRDDKIALVVLSQPGAAGLLYLDSDILADAFLATILIRSVTITPNRASTAPPTKMAS